MRDIRAMRAKWGLRLHPEPTSIAPESGRRSLAKANSLKLYIIYYILYIIHRPLWGHWCVRTKCIKRVCTWGSGGRCAPPLHTETRSACAETRSACAETRSVCAETRSACAETRSVPFAQPPHYIILYSKL